MSANRLVTFSRQSSTVIRATGAPFGGLAAPRGPTGTPRAKPQAARGQGRCSWGLAHVARERCGRLSFATALNDRRTGPGGAKSGGGESAGAEGGGSGAGRKTPTPSPLAATPAPVVATPASKSPWPGRILAVALLGVVVGAAS